MEYTGIFMYKMSHQEKCIRAATAIDCNGTISLSDGLYIVVQMDTVSDNYQRWLTANFGGKLAPYERNKNRKSQYNERKERMTWYKRNQEAVEFLKQIAPYMLTKKERAELMIDLGEKQAKLEQKLSTIQRKEMWAEYAQRLKTLNNT